MLRNRGPEVPLRARPRPGRAARHAVHGAVPCRTGPPHSDRPRRGQLLRRARRPRSGSRPTVRWSSATRQPTGEVDRRRQSERIGCSDRRHLQRGAQRRRHDAAPRARVRSGAGQRGRSAVIRSNRAFAETGAGRTRMTSMPAVLERHGLKRRRIRPHRGVSRPRAEPDRARHLLGDVVRALQLQELARPSADAADRRPAGAAGAWRERRRRRHRRRAGRGLQDRVAQPSVVHRAVPGRGDRRRRHHPRHLHDGRAADRADELAAVRAARRAAAPRVCSKASSPALPATATASACRPSAARSPSSRPTPAIRW